MPSGPTRRWTSNIPLRSNGEIRWKGELIFVSQVLIGEPVGISRTVNGEWRVRYADVELGFIDVGRCRLNRQPHNRAEKR